VVDYKKKRPPKCASERGMGGVLSLVKKQSKEENSCSISN